MDDIAIIDWAEEEISLETRSILLCLRNYCAKWQRTPGQMTLNWRNDTTSILSHQIADATMSKKKASKTPSISPPIYYIDIFEKRSNAIIADVRSELEQSFKELDDELLANSTIDKSFLESESFDDDMSFLDEWVANVLYSYIFLTSVILDEYLNNGSIIYSENSEQKEYLRKILENRVEKKELIEDILKPLMDTAKEISDSRSQIPPEIIALIKSDAQRTESEMQPTTDGVWNLLKWQWLMLSLIK